MNNGPLVHNQFSRFFYETGGFLQNTWTGVPIIKCPFDMHMIQELIFTTKPQLIVETGAYLGGSTKHMADLMDIVGQGQVVSVEVDTELPLPVHDRITFLRGVSSTSSAALEFVRGCVFGKRTMCVLDSAHNKQHVLDELRLYAPFVSKGCYLIVEDTNVHGYPFGPDADLIETEGGPAEALEEWGPRDHGFEVDRGPERLRMSFNPGGYLKCVR